MSNGENNFISRASKYSEACENWRFYVDQRTKILGFYLTTFTGLCVWFSWAQPKDQANIVAVAGIIITIAYRAIEWRNRILYQKSSKYAEILEKDEDLNNKETKGIATVLEKSYENTTIGAFFTSFISNLWPFNKKYYPTISRVMDWIYFIIILLCSGYLFSQLFNIKVLQEIIMLLVSEITLLNLIAFVSVIAACLAAGFAYKAIKENKKISDAALVMRFYSDYGSKEFCDALRTLKDYKIPKKLNVNYYEETDASRRKVKFFYLTISRLREQNLIDDKTCRVLIEQSGYEILIDKIKRLEKLIDPSGESTIDWIEVLERSKKTSKDE